MPKKEKEKLDLNLTLTKLPMRLRKVDKVKEEKSVTNKKIMSTQNELKHMI